MKVEEGGIRAPPRETPGNSRVQTTWAVETPKHSGSLTEASKNSTHFHMAPPSTAHTSGLAASAAVDLSVLTAPLACTDSPEERLRRQLEIVRSLARIYVPAWRNLPPHSVTAKPLSGGLSNRLFVVDAELSQLRGYEEEDLGEGEKGGDEGHKHGSGTESSARRLSENGEARAIAEKQAREASGEGRDDKQGTSRNEEVVTTQRRTNEEKGKRSRVTASPFSHRGEGTKKEDESEREVSERNAQDQQKTCCFQEGAGGRVELAEVPTRVLIRVYGHPADTELFDPRVEQRLFKQLGEVGIAPRCLGEFEGGRVEAWLEGQPLKTADLHTEEIQTKLASQLADFHETRLHPTRPSASEATRRVCRWRALLPSSFPSDSSPPSQASANDDGNRLHASSASHLPSPSHEIPSCFPSTSAASASPSLSSSSSLSPSTSVFPGVERSSCGGSRAANLEKNSPFVLAGACECVFCRMQTWISLAEKAQREAQARACPLLPSAATETEEKNGVSACTGGRQTREERVEEHTVGENNNRRKKNAGVEVPENAKRLTDAKKTMEMMAALNLETYRKKAEQLREAILKRVESELSPESLQTVYGSEERWRLLSAASLVLSHNDLQENNLMSDNEHLHLIDFEYASENLRGFDVANLFCEFAIDYTTPKHFPFYSVVTSNFPSSAVRGAFIRLYLHRVLSLAKLRKERLCTAGGNSTHAVVATEKLGYEDALPPCRQRKEATEFSGEDDAHATDISDAVVTNFDRLVLLLALASHLLWAFWSVIKAPLEQAENDFPYLHYAAARLKMYDAQEMELVRLGLFSPALDTGEDSLLLEKTG
ncbi:phosphotransferase enzyme family protein [Toxoplasma gondii RUB]|uniref:Phosphotransferase enzyme family protein n=2 Tax=Toxoplasma gondii TaxID=5811 RepID=A0A086LNQ0_TOXGO|nr:phosphotransferase enzyme family protein [Toxoplasma gondii RUB]